MLQLSFRAPDLQTSAFTHPCISLCLCAVVSPCCMCLQSASVASVVVAASARPKLKPRHSHSPRVCRCWCCCWCCCAVDTVRLASHRQLLSCWHGVDTCTVVHAVMSEPVLAGVYSRQLPSVPGSLNAASPPANRSPSAFGAPSCACALQVVAGAAAAAGVLMAAMEVGVAVAPTAGAGS